MSHRRNHPLHQHIGMRRHRQIEAEEFMLRVQGYRRGGTQPEKMDLPRLDEHVHRLADQGRVQLLARAVQ